MSRSLRLRIGFGILVIGGLFGLRLNLAQTATPPLASSPPGAPMQSFPNPPTTAPVYGAGITPAPSVGIPGMMPSGFTMGGSAGMGGASAYTESQMAEMQLAIQARDLLRTYSPVSTAETQANLKKSLRAILIAQFDLQHSRRDEELKRIEKRLLDLRAKLTKRADAKTTIVDRRLEQLISDIDGLGWGADDLPQDLFDLGMRGAAAPAGGMGAPMMGPGAMHGGVLPAGPVGRGMHGGSVPGRIQPATKPATTKEVPGRSAVGTGSSGPGALPGVERLTRQPATVPGGGAIGDENPTVPANPTAPDLPSRRAPVLPEPSNSGASKAPEDAALPEAPNSAKNEDVPEARLCPMLRNGGE